MTESIVREPKILACENCWDEAENDMRLGRDDTIPAGWGFMLITRNEGIASNSLLCDLCLQAIRTAMGDRRIETLTKPADALSEKVAEAKEALAETITVTQLGTDNEAVVNVSEFDPDLGETAESQAAQAATEAEADKNAEEARKEIERIEAEEKEDALAEVPVTKPAVKPTTTRNQRRAAAQKKAQEEAELANLERKFEEAGGRGVDMAERIDELRDKLGKA
jgi:hypothetical protein